MSEPWVLTDWDDTLDVNDVMDGDTYVKTQLRDHYVFSRTKILTATEVSAWASAVGTSSGTISAQLGDVSFFRSMSAGAYICVKDRVGPYEHPAAFGRQDQTWEYYSAWRDAPEDWGGTPEFGAPPEE